MNAATPEPYAVASQVDDKALVDRRRRQIVAAATELFGRTGFHRTTIKDIAAKAGVSIGLIYQYVRDKEDVLLLVLVDLLECYKREIPPAIAAAADPVARCRAAVDAYCRIIDAHREATLLAYRETASLDDRRRRIIKDLELESNALIAACVEDCVAGGWFRPVDVELVTYQLVMAAHGWALKGWRFRDITSLDAYIAHTLDVLLAGLLSDKARGKG